MPQKFHKLLPFIIITIHLLLNLYFVDCVLLSYQVKRNTIFILQHNTHIYEPLKIQFHIQYNEEKLKLIQGNK